MRVSMESEKKVKTSGLIFKTHTPYVAVSVDVQFTEEELAIIKENDLEDMIVLERPPDVLHAERARKLELDDHPHSWSLRVRHLLEGRPDVFNFGDPAQAKGYEDRVKAALIKLKEYLDASANVGEKTSFEL